LVKTIPCHALQNVVYLLTFSDTHWNDKYMHLAKQQNKFRTYNINKARNSVYSSYCQWGSKISES
jgi:hypothetical protein